MSSLRAACALALLAGIAACGSEPSNTGSTPPAATAQQTPPPASPPAPISSAVTPAAGTEVAEADLPPLPITSYPAARPMEVVRAVFTFAAVHPEVLSRIPCFCGCERQGHRHNDDCFVAGRDAKGKVTKWEPHGIGCGICIDVAQDAMQMHNAGIDLPTIRKNIEGKYRALGDSITPTPPITSGK